MELEVFLFLFSKGDGECFKNKKLCRVCDGGKIIFFWWDGRGIILNGIILLKLLIWWNFSDEFYYRKMVENESMLLFCDCGNIMFMFSFNNYFNVR